MRKQQQQQEFPVSPKGSWNALVAILLVYQRCLIPPWRGRFGVEALGFVCVFSFAAMAVWAWCWQDPLMWGYLAFWLVCVFWRRMEARRLIRKGWRIHSLSDGWPLTFGLSEGNAKLRLEPILALLAGVGLWFLSRHLNTPPGLAFFVGIGAFALNAVEALKQRMWRRRTQAIMDARAEQEGVMQMYRSRWGDS